MTVVKRGGPVRRTLLTIVGILAVVGLAYGGFLLFGSGSASTAPRLNYTLVTPQQGTLSATVNASGTMQPRSVVNLSFSSTGTVAEVLTEVGTSVAKDAPLARLDSRDLELRVRQSQAALAQAQAGYERLRAGSSPEEIAAAQAQLAQSQAQLRQVQGNVTANDVAAARAQLEQAQAALAELLGGPKETDVRQAQAEADQVQANFQAQRDSLSTAKSRAQSQLEQAANTLRDRQADYSRIYWENRRLEDQLNRFSQELPQQNKDQEAAALRAVQTAEESLSQAQLAYEQAQQAEITGVAAAEAQVRSAQARLDNLLAGADADQIAAARAQVAQAEANLNKLLGDQRAGSLGVANAAVANANANLSRITASPREADLANAEAQVQSAQAALEQAQLALDRATLRAPFAGTVAEVNLKAGELPGATRAAIVLADLSSFYVDVTVDEIDVAQLAPNQPVRLTLDALPNLALDGTVARIDPLATAGASVTSYSVRIETKASDARVRSGMSANADIVVAEKANVLMVPRRAVRADRGEFFVDVTEDQGLCQADVANRPLNPPLRAVAVTTGLSNEQFIEITASELTTSSCMHVEGVDARLNPLGGPPPGARRNP